MVTLLKINNGKYISIKITKSKEGRLSSCVYSNNCGWVDQYRNGETIYQVIVNEIKTIKAKLKEKKKDASLKWLLLELNKQRLNQSQLKLF